MSRLGEAGRVGVVGKRTPILIALAVVFALGALGCGEKSAAPEPAMSATNAQEEETSGDGAQAVGEDPNPDRDKPPAKGTAIELGDSQFGPVLFDETGQAIYLFDKETSEESQCYGECAAEWPPVLTDGEPQAGPGLSQGKLGVTDRRDGTRQVTYNGHPLYLYAHEGPGEVRCHNVPGFGGIWLALNAAGDPA
jgi:predicted lipoprotein with Yx(FWY)xxD motif